MPYYRMLAFRFALDAVQKQFHTQVIYAMDVGCLVIHNQTEW